MNVATSPLTGPRAPCTKDEEPARLINLFTPELPVHPADTRHNSPCFRQGPRLPLGTPAGRPLCTQPYGLKL